MLVRKTAQLNSQNLPLVKALLSKSKGSQQGFTLIECLVAIVIVAVVISAITPPILVSMATRVQNHRAEQARQLAQAKVDEIRRLVETGNYNQTILDNYAHPDVSGTGKVCNATNIPFRPEQRVDIDNGVARATDTINPNNKYDFWVQAFRNEGVIDQNTNKPVAFDLGVRVYRYRYANGTEILPTQINRASLQFPGSTPPPSAPNQPDTAPRTTLKDQYNQPLVTLYTKIVLSDNQTSLDNYKKIIGNVSPATPDVCPQ